eukprot:SAG22_NODE_115_length_19315_cov_10.458368_8_plen_775_part_00
MGLDAVLLDEYESRPDGSSSWDELFGDGGCIMTEACEKFVYKTMHHIIVENHTVDGVGCFASGVLPLLFHWGDVAAANKNADIGIEGYCECVTDGSTSAAAIRMLGSGFWPVILHLLGRNEEAHELILKWGVDAARCDATLDELAEINPGLLARGSETEGQVHIDIMKALAKAAHVLVSGEKAVPGHPDIMAEVGTPEHLRKVSCLCGQSHMIVIGNGLVWFALAFERLGDAERALAFANESLVTEGPGGVTDLSTGANPCVWTHTLAHGVRGRVLAACGDAAGAAQALEAADAAACSRDYWFFEFLAAKDMLGVREDATAQQVVKQKLAKLAGSEKELYQLADRRFDGWLPIEDNRADRTRTVTVAAARGEPVAADPHAALRAELSALTLSAAKRRARVAGVDQAAIDDADDTEDPKQAVVELVLAVAASTAAAQLQRAAQGREELTPMKMSALRKRALAVGLSADDVDAVDDSDDPRAALVELIVAATGGGAEDDAEKSLQLREELSQLKMSALRKQARGTDVNEEAVDAVDDSDDPRAALVELIVAATGGGAGDDAEKSLQLREELSQLKMSALRKRARGTDVDEEAVDAVDDSDDPRAALVELIVVSRATSLPAVSPSVSPAPRPAPAPLADVAAKTVGRRPHHGTGARGVGAVPAVDTSTAPASGGRRECGQHAMISYQWACQSLVVKAKEAIQNKGCPCWIDIEGGMDSDLYDSMAVGVANAACVVCFIDSRYQVSGETVVLLEAPFPHHLPSLVVSLPFLVPKDPNR